MRHLLPFKTVTTPFGLSAVFLSVASLYYMVPKGPFFGVSQRNVGEQRRLAPLSPSKTFTFESPSNMGELPNIQDALSQKGGEVRAAWLPPLLRPKNTREMRDLFVSCAFCLRKVQEGKSPVPRVYVSHFPEDWRNPKTEKTRHQFFVQMVLPLVLAENERILNLRERAVQLFQAVNAGKTLNAVDRQWLRQLAVEYKVKPMDEGALLARLDAVPPSLALAQSILESGFGRSHAAMNKNSIFGHMQTTTEVRPYPTLHHSVISYIQNLNRHRAYRYLHAIRYQQRKQGKVPSGLSLTRGLMAYSERGKAYIRDLQYLIQRYRLERFDTATLHPQ